RCRPACTRGWPSASSWSDSLAKSTRCSTSPKRSRPWRASASRDLRGWRISRVKAQRVDMFVSTMATPADTSGLQKLADSGKIKPDTLVALVGKTEGTGQHDDWGRVWADVALREWTAKFLGIPVAEVAHRVIFVLSGGCPGVITPHIAAVTREWVEAPERPKNGDKRLVVGRAASDAIAPEEVGRMGQIRKVAEATQKAMADAGLTDPKDVHL